MEGKTRKSMLLQSPYIKIKAKVTMPGYTNGIPNIKEEERYVVAPSAKNFQPTKVYAVQSEENLAKIRELTVATFGAPTVLVICSEDEKAWVSPFTGFNSGVMDVSIMGAHMMLQAAEELLKEGFTPKRDTVSAIRKVCTGK